MNKQVYEVKGQLQVSVPEDPRLHPQAGPAARRGGGAAAVSGDGGLPVDVPLTGQRGHAP